MAAPEIRSFAQFVTLPPEDAPLVLRNRAPRREVLATQRVENGDQTIVAPRF